MLRLILSFFILANFSFADSKIKVVTTTSLISDLIKNIGGDKLEIKSLMGAGVDPHLYKASQGDLRDLLSADIIFYNGLHLEGKMSDTLETLSKRKKVFAVSTTVPKESLRFPSDFQGQPDPHIWFDVKMWIHAAHAVETALSASYPEHADIFKQNSQIYTQKLNQLDEWVKHELLKISKPQRVLITAHDAFGYFGQAYEVEVLGLQGISTASEFGLADVTRLVDIIISRKIKAIFVESSVPQRYILALQEGVQAKGFKVDIGGQLYSDSLGDEKGEEGNYIGMVKYNVNLIVKALK